MVTEFAPHTFGLPTLGEVAAEPSAALRLADIRLIETEYDRLAGPGHPASSLLPGVNSVAGVAVVGLDGHLFIANGANGWERQFLEGIVDEDEWVSSWRAVYAARQSRAAQLGVPLVNIIVPEKHALFAASRWVDADAGGAGARRPVNALLRALSPQDRVLYPEQRMRDAGGIAFLRHDSHWSASGCCSATQSVLDELSVEVDLETTPLLIRQVNTPRDLCRHFFPDPPPEMALELAPHGVVALDTSRPEGPHRNTGAFYAIVNNDAPDPRTVMVFGDSYSYLGGFCFALSAVFHAVIFIWSKDVDWDAVTANSPDIVICESAERFLLTVANS